MPLPNMGTLKNLSVQSIFVVEMVQFKRLQRLQSWVELFFTVFYLKITCMIILLQKKRFCKWSLLWDGS